MHLATPASQILICEKCLTRLQEMHPSHFVASFFHPHKDVQKQRIDKSALVNLLVHKKCWIYECLTVHMVPADDDSNSHRFTLFSPFILLSFHKHLKMPGSAEKLHCHLHIYNVMYFLFYFNWKTHPTIQPKSVPISHLMPPSRHIFYPTFSRFFPATILFVHPSAPFHGSSTTTLCRCIRCLKMRKMLHRTL